MKKQYILIIIIIFIFSNISCNSSKKTTKTKFINKKRTNVKKLEEHAIKPKIVKKRKKNGIFSKMFKRTFTDKDYAFEFKNSKIKQALEIKEFKKANDYEQKGDYSRALSLYETAYSIKKNDYIKKRITIIKYRLGEKKIREDFNFKQALNSFENKDYKSAINYANNIDNSTVYNKMISTSIKVEAYKKMKNTKKYQEEYKKFYTLKGQVYNALGEAYDY